MGRSPRTRHVLLFLLPALVAFTARPVAAQPQRPATPDSPDSYVSFHDGRGYFPLVEHGRAAPLVVSGSDYPGVVRVVGDLRDDIERVSGVRPAVARDEVPDARNVVIVGTIGESPLIDGLVASGKLDVGGIAGKWETSLEQVVDDPLPGVRRAFVIAGSDQRGTIYGAYDVRKDASETPQVWTRTVTVHAVVEKPETDNAHGFVEAGGYVSMNAGHYSRASRTSEARWKRVPGIGRTGAGMEPFPVTAPGLEPGKGPRLEYDMTLTTTGPVKVWAYLSPRNSVLSTEGLRYAVSIDGAEPQVANITEATGANATTMNKQWERNTSDNVNRTVTTHTVTEPGVHTLKFWMIDPTVVLQKIVVDTGGLRASYLGPPESRRAGFRSTPTPQGGTKP